MRNGLYRNISLDALLQLSLPQRTEMEGDQTRHLGTQNIIYGSAKEMCWGPPSLGTRLDIAFLHEERVIPEQLTGTGS